jgi:sodium-coupled monocarboxylate transporter 8/12
LADKDMAILPVAFSLMASFMSAISLMGLTREIYMYGTQFLVVNISYLVRNLFNP